MIYADILKCYSVNDNDTHCHDNEQEVIQMNIPEIIAYIAIGYFFVALTVLYLLSVSSSYIDKAGGEKSRKINTDEEFEEYRKAA